MFCSATPKSRRLRFTTAVVAGAFLVFFGQSAQASTDAATSRSLVNSTRASHGLGSLSADAGLDEMARAQAARMVARDAIYHNPNLQSDAGAAGVSWTLIGENVGVGPDVETVHQAFMNSSGHKANIVHGDYNRIGVGTATGKDGSVFVAHVFARVESAARSAPATATAAPVATTQATTAPAASGASPTASAPSAAPVSAPSAVASSDAASVPADPTTPNALVGGVVNV